MTNVPSRKPGRRKTSPYHAAAFTAFAYLLRKHVKNGDVTLTDEHQLSERPLKIDIMIIKKNRDVKIKTNIGRIFRRHNIVEYKSPADSSLKLSDFDKVVHGYAGIYAAQNNVKLTDMTVSIVCYRKPVKLFETLEKEFDYKILKKYSGIYYIIPKGASAEKTLSIQIIVSPELPDSELALKALKAGFNEETAEKVEKLIFSADGKRMLLDSYWGKVVASKNINTLIKAADMREGDKIIEVLKAHGLWEKHERKMREDGMREGRLEGRREGRREGIREGKREGRLEGMEKAYALFKKGYSLEEAKAELQLA